MSDSQVISFVYYYSKHNRNTKCAFHNITKKIWDVGRKRREEDKKTLEKNAFRAQKKTVHESRNKERKNSEYFSKPSIEVKCS